jgi:hypothetical protein
MNHVTGFKSHNDTPIVTQSEEMVDTVLNERHTVPVRVWKQYQKYEGEGCRREEKSIVLHCQTDCLS